jgi:predicted nucleotide-binding protein
MGGIVGGDQCYRARQNVILELGYFVGMLGRKRVCALKKGDIEVPTDYHGVAYVDLDVRGGWKLQLAQEMVAAGMRIDMNKAIAA